MSGLWAVLGSASANARVLARIPRRIFGGSFASLSRAGLVHTTLTRRSISTEFPLDILLVDQLAPGGVMVVPVGRQGGDQALLRLTREADGIREEVLDSVRFVPLVMGLPSNAA